MTQYFSKTEGKEQPTQSYRGRENILPTRTGNQDVLGRRELRGFVLRADQHFERAGAGSLVGEAVQPQEGGWGQWEGGDTAKQDTCAFPCYASRIRFGRGSLCCFTEARNLGRETVLGKVVTWTGK